MDQDDFGALQVCFTGVGGGVPTGCECFNRASSTPEGIDADDFAEFAKCWTGPNVLYSVALPSGCNP